MAGKGKQNPCSGKRVQIWTLKTGEGHKVVVWVRNFDLRKHFSGKWKRYYNLVFFYVNSDFNTSTFN